VNAVILCDVRCSGVVFSLFFFVYWHAVYSVEHISTCHHFLSVGYIE
jgi:hypothetical protein